MEKSDLSEELHNSDGGALAKYEGSTDERHHPPNREDDSGGQQVVPSGQKMMGLTFSNILQPNLNSLNETDGAAALNLVWPLLAALNKPIIAFHFTLFVLLYLQTVP